jgi:uncharacterized protein
MWHRSLCHSLVQHIFAQQNTLMILSASYNQTSIKEIKNSFVVNKVKEIVYRYDKEAEIILFGSRARGDWHEESDWDFLVLSELDERTEVKEKIREDILSEIEYKIFEVVFTLFHNKKVWEEDYAVTDIYDSIAEDGINI